MEFGWVKGATFALETKMEKKMKESRVKNYTLDELIRLVRPTDNLALHNHCIVLRLGGEFSIPMSQLLSRVDAAAVCYVSNGSGRITYLTNSYEIVRNALFLIPPGSVVELQIEEPITEGYLMLVDQSYMQEADINLKKIIGVMLDAKLSTGMFRLDEGESDRMQKAFELALATVSNDAQTPFRDDVVQAVIKLMLYKICELLATHHGVEEVDPIHATRAEEYFRRFLRELGQHYRERQTVTYYADQLCISSRYLTTIVRRVSGLTVSDWLNRYVIAEAKHLLKYSEMSIQEIAYALNFPNQSFFGKYFKQHTGVSPSAYRQQ